MVQADVTITADYAERLLQEKIAGHQRLLDDVSRKTALEAQRLDALRAEYAKTLKAHQTLTEELASMGTKKAEQDARLKAHEQSVLDALHKREAVTAQKEGDSHAREQATLQAHGAAKTAKAQVLGVRDDLRKAIASAQSGLAKAAQDAEKILAAL